MQDEKDKESAGRSKHGKSDPPEKLADAKRLGGGDPDDHQVRRVEVSLGRKPSPSTPDEALWEEIEARLGNLSFKKYSDFIDDVLCDADPAYRQRSGHELTYRGDLTNKLRAELRQHLFGPDAYELLRVSTEFFLMHAACDLTGEVDLSKYLRPSSQGHALLPYLTIIQDRLGAPLGRAGRLGLGSDDECFSVNASRIASPCFIELIWSYWHEQGMLVQTINNIAIRYQNIRQGRGRDPLAAFEIDPLRPLNNVLWGYLQDEHRRLSLVRRAYEYDHHYGLRLTGRAIPDLRPADSRAKFLPAFHELLYQTHSFYKDDDVATVQADAFPVVNALRELHFVLTEGMHNQFGDLPSQARVEMMIQQWLLSRTEIRDFLRGRAMVPFPELWMDSVDTMKSLQGWSDVPVLYFNELAKTGEQLLLSVRWADWATQDSNSISAAANWARRHRAVVQRYVYAYRMITGVDLTVDRVEVQSSQARLGQPPIRMRVRSTAVPRQQPRIMDADLDLLGPGPSDQALMPSRQSRGYRR